MRRMKFALVAAGFAVLLAACGNAAAGGGTADANGCTQKGAAAAGATAAQTITIVSDPNTVGAFTPSQVTISAGQSVEWVWQDPNVQHTTTSDDGTMWDSCLQGSGAKFMVTFAKAGTYSYHCTIHPMMIGKVIVK